MGGCSFSIHNIAYSLRIFKENLAVDIASFCLPCIKYALLFNVRISDSRGESALKNLGGEWLPCFYVWKRQCLLRSSSCLTSIIPVYLRFLSAV